MNDDAGMYQAAANMAYARECDMGRPSMVLRPRIFIDGNKWCALYGENIQDGVAGFGDSPEDAFRDFDRAWTRPLRAVAEKAP